jgi:hypothetical protein
MPGNRGRFPRVCREAPVRTEPLPTTLSDALCPNTHEAVHEATGAAFGLAPEARGSLGPEGRAVGGNGLTGMSNTVVAAPTR